MKRRPNRSANEVRCNAQSFEKGVRCMENSVAKEVVTTKFYVFSLIRHF